MTGFAWVLDTGRFYGGALGQTYWSTEGETGAELVAGIEQEPVLACAVRGALDLGEEAGGRLAQDTAEEGRADDRLVAQLVARRDGAVGGQQRQPGRCPGAAWRAVDLAVR